MSATLPTPEVYAAAYYSADATDLAALDIAAGLIEAEQWRVWSIATHQDTPQTQALHRAALEQKA